jgi:hypothetical protein
MSISRRQFVSGSAITAVGAVIPIADAGAGSGEGPLTEQDDIKVMLDIMERQIAKIREYLAESDADPIKSTHAVKMESCVLHHRAHALADRSDIVRRLAFGVTLAEQRAEYERLRGTQYDAAFLARRRLQIRDSILSPQRMDG